MTASKRAILFLIPALCAIAQMPSDSVRVPMANWGRVRVATDYLLNWKIGMQSNLGQLTFSEAAARADAEGLAFVEGFSSQRVSAEIPKNLDSRLSPDEQASVKKRLAGLRLSMTVYHAGSTRGADRGLFEFAKTLGVETIVADAPAADVPALDKLANEFGIDVALAGSGHCADPKALLAETEGLSPRIGIAADMGCWIEAGTKPAEAFEQTKNRLKVVNLQDRSALGTKGHKVVLNNGAATLPEFFNAVYQAGSKPVFFSVGAANEPELARWLDGLETALHAVVIDRVHQLSLTTPISSPDKLSAEDRGKIDAALPHQATATPKKSRKILVMDLQLGYYHPTVADVNYALELLSKYTGAFQPVFSNDLDNLKYEKLHQYDALFLNSVVGQVFLDPEIRTSLLRFVREGGGLIGLHGATYAALDWPEFGEMIGAQEGPHRVETATIKIDDPNSPLTAAFEGQEFVRQDEFYHFLPTGPYSRNKLHVLLSIDAQKSDLSAWHVRPDNDYGLAWIRTYGKGRVFTCAMGHTATFFMTPQIARFMLAGIQYAVGDLDADATPSAKLAAKGK